MILVVNPNAGISNLKDFIDKAKATSGGMSYGSAGAGSPHHLAMELVKVEAKLPLVHVPYKGAAPSLQDVAGGQLPAMMVDLAAGNAFIKGGKVKPIAVANATRLPQLPDVPTMAELGYKEVEAYAWQGLVVPAATPKDLVQRLSSEMQAALANAEVRRKLAEAAWEPVPSDANLMSVYTLAETRKWHKLIRERNIALEG
jgi:tripartite-type tricarboxylate transporter receptor subunit TctC